MEMKVVEVLEKNRRNLILGGSTLYIETTVRPQVQSAQSENDASQAATQGSLEVTGNLGDVMKESSKIAFTFAKNFMASLPEEEASKSAKQFLISNHIHLHVPEVGLGEYYLYSITFVAFLTV